MMHRDSDKDVESPAETESQTQINVEEDIQSIDRPPSSHESSVKASARPAKLFHAYSHHVLALLVPFSIFGVLARLGLQALATYNGQSIFPLSYPQALGCLVMGFVLHLKEPIGHL